MQGGGRGQLLAVQMIPCLGRNQGQVKVKKGTSEPGSNDLDGGGDDNSDGQDEEESGSERK